MRRLIYLVWLLAAVLLTPVAVAEDAQSLFAGAFEAKAAGDLRTAQRLFEEGLRLDPNNALARKYLGEVSDTLTNAQAIFARAYNAKAGGALRGARRLFEQGLALEPGNADAKQLLAEVNDTLAKAQALFEQAYSAKVAGDRRGAQRLFEQGLALDTGNADANQFLAEVRVALASPPRTKSPKEVCTGRPNFISRAICEKHECENPTNARLPYCEQYLLSKPKLGDIP